MFPSVSAPLYRIPSSMPVDDYFVHTNVFFGADEKSVEFTRTSQGLFAQIGFTLEFTKSSLKIPTSNPNKNNWSNCWYFGYVVGAWTCARDRRLWHWLLLCLYSIVDTFTFFLSLFAQVNLFVAEMVRWEDIVKTPLSRSLPTLCIFSRFAWYKHVCSLSVDDNWQTRFGKKARTFVCAQVWDSAQNTQWNPFDWRK